MTEALDAVYEPDQVAEAERDLEHERLAAIDVARLRKMVDDFRDGTEPSRLVGEQCRRYYDNKQIEGPTLAALKRSRQPRVIRNEITPAINGLLGIVRQSKVDPKAWPRNPNNEEQADVASKALRFVSDRNRLHSTKEECAGNLFIEGVMGAAVEVDERSDVVILQVRADEMIYDPRSRKLDFSDAQYKGIGKWMYEGDVRAMYPDIKDEISSAFSSAGADMGLGHTFADKPDVLLGERWLDKRSRRMFVVELHHREADGWERSVFFVGGVLENGLSPYHDEHGQPVSNLVFRSCFIDGENQRYGPVALMLSGQDELNAYGSRALHLANSRQIQAVPGEVPEVSSKVASAEAAKANGVIPSGWQVVPTADLFQGIQIMMADARQSLVRQAPTPGVLADAANDQSGRARLVVQQAGMTEVAILFGRIEDWENDIYRTTWNALKQYKTEPWWVRITGDDGKNKFLPVNMPQPMQQDGAMVVGMDGQPRMEIKNNLAEMDVDIEVETIPDTANLQAEQFETIAPMLPLLAEAKGAEAAFKVGLALSSFPDKARIKEMLEAPSDDPAAQQQAAAAAQAQQQQQELAMRGAMAQIGETESKTALNVAKAEESKAGVAIEAIAAMAGLNPPPQDA